MLKIFTKLHQMPCLNDEEKTKNKYKEIKNSKSRPMYWYEKLNCNHRSRGTKGQRFRRKRDHGGMFKFDDVLKSHINHHETSRFSSPWSKSSIPSADV